MKATQTSFWEYVAKTTRPGGTAGSSSRNTRRRAHGALFAFQHSLDQ
jgi:hypothetical protein